MELHVSSGARLLRRRHKHVAVVQVALGARRVLHDVSQALATRPDPVRF